MNYPSGVKKPKSKPVSYANRGMVLEDIINDSNQYYLVSNKAVIHKKPTPITISKVNYPSRFEAVIKEAYFKTPSTTDYNGIYKGHYLDFEAKETKSKTSFPIKNIHPHQINHLKQVVMHHGIAFLIIRFTLLDEIYLLKAEDFLTWIKQKQKSIPIAYIREYGYLLKEQFQPRVDYLTIIDQIYLGGDQNETNNK